MQEMQELTLKQYVVDAFTDRVFAGNTELTSLDAPLELAPDETITLIRLTMLAGRMW